MFENEKSSNFNKNSLKKMGSQLSTPTGGLSVTFPIGSLVRVVDQKPKESRKVHSLSWNNSAHGENLGLIGIVCGGGADSKYDVAYVCFSGGYENESRNFEFDGTLFRSEWLKLAEDVPSEEINRLKEVLFEAVRATVCSRLQYEKNLCESECGVTGDFVKIVSKPENGETSDGTWCESMNMTVGKIGVIVAGIKPESTMVCFMEPRYGVYTYKNSSLQWIDFKDDQKVDNKEQLMHARKMVIEEKEDLETGLKSIEDQPKMTHEEAQKIIQNLVKQKVTLALNIGSKQKLEPNSNENGKENSFVKKINEDKKDKICYNSDIPQI